MAGELRKLALPSKTTHPEGGGVLSYRQTGAILLGLRSSHQALVPSWFPLALVVCAVVLVKQAVSAFLFLYSNPWFPRFWDL